MNPNPEINFEAAAQEVKEYLDKKKLDLVDWNYWQIECYPDPGDDDYPELKKFAAMWSEVFDYADEVTYGDNGEGFPHEIVAKYEDATRRVQDLVNEDSRFWEEIREEVMPLYRPPSGPSNQSVWDLSWAWAEMRDKVFAGTDLPDKVATEPTDMKDMQYLLQRWDSLGEHASQVYVELRQEDMDADDFRLLCKNWFDRMVLEKWQERWKGVEIHYDPVGLDVVTTQMWTNKATGERTRGDVLSSRKLPPGFIIRVL